MTATTPPYPRYSHYIDGTWVDAPGSDTFDVLDPYFGDVYARAAAGSASDAERAVVAAQRAFPAWAELPPADNQQLFLRAADIMQARRAELIEILARETGRAPWNGAASSHRDPTDIPGRQLPNTESTHELLAAYRANAPGAVRLATLVHLDEQERTAQRAVKEVTDRNYEVIA